MITAVKRDDEKSTLGMVLAESPRMVKAGRNRTAEHGLGAVPANTEVSAGNGCARYSVRL